MGKTLSYDYQASSTSTVEAFINSTQAKGNGWFITFKIKDTSNIFGLGANSWLRGMIYYQNQNTGAYSVDGQGFIYKADVDIPYAVKIAGKDSSTYGIATYTLQAELTNPLTQSDVVNNLTSTSTVKPLSAAQGKALNDKISALGGATKLYGRAEPTIAANFTISNASSYRFIMVNLYNDNSNTAQMIDQVVLPQSVWKSTYFIRLWSTIDSQEKWIVLRRTNDTSVYCVDRNYGFIEIYGIK